MTFRHVPTLLRRELAAYFLGPMALLVLLAFQAIAWIDFNELLTSLAGSRGGLANPIGHYIASSPPFWIALMVAIPALTMRLLAEESRSGTIEGLLTVPITEGEVVVAKWLAGTAMYLAILLPFAIYLPFLYVQGRYRFDTGPLASLAIGMTTLGMMFVAVGLLFSALSKNQVVAAIWTFVFLFVTIFLTRLAQGEAVARQSPWAEPIRFVSALDQVNQFALGQLDLRFVVLHLSVCALALFLTTTVVRWRREG